MKSRRTLVVTLVVGLMVATVALPAEAKKKKKKKPKPVATTMFMEGEASFGEEEQTAVIGGGFLKLQAEAGSGEKSMGMPNLAATPNMNCAGNSFWPVFIGDISGRILGDMEVSFNAFGQGGEVEVRVWPDIAQQACNDNYVEPAGAAVVDMPAGEGLVEATIEDLDFTAESVMMIQLTPVVSAPPYYGRAFYGTEDSKAEFKCIPPKGQKACISGG